MNKEQAKDLLPIIQAYVEGKTIESRCIKGGTSLWYDDNNPSFDEDFEYRIKAEPKYRPFKDAEECFEEMQKHQPFGWIKSGKMIFNIISIGADGIIIHNSISNSGYSFGSASSLTFVDGKPFGIKE